MKVFSPGERVKLDSELLYYSANKHWIGKRGTVMEVLDCSHVLVKWDHLVKTMVNDIGFIERAY